MKNRYQNRNLLRLLARSHGIATSFIDYRNKRQCLPPEVLCALISSISGESISLDTTAEELRCLYDKERLVAVEKILPPSIVAWDGRLPKFWAWLREDVLSLDCEIIPEEEGHALRQAVVVDGKAGRRTIQGKKYVRARIDWDANIPYGYYRFVFTDQDGNRGESFLISAPAKLADLPRRWGAFAPAYALRGEHTQGIGGYSELLEAAQTIKHHGGEFLGTLPLLPLFYEGESPEISPYSPVSRLFWNEIFLDLTHLPGPYKTDGDGPQEFTADTVDYAAVYAYKKKILLEASDAFFAAYPVGDESYQSYLLKSPHLDDYAEFRARQIKDEDFFRIKRFHLYVQYACHLQLSRIREAVEAGQAAPLYLDYTVGVHRDGFDAQRMSDQFLKGYQVGAPPDKTFIQGQTWGFEPLHPRRLEESRYRYLRDCFHHYFQYSKIIRIDHIMGLHRLFCVPNGADARHGTYVYYNLNTQIGVLCLEAWRHGATVVGEDLGVVPDRIREAMEEHKIFRMWIGQNDIGPHPKKSFAKIKPAMIAALNTHDMYPFAAYMKGEDLETLHAMGILEDKFYVPFKKERGSRLVGLSKMANPYLGAIDGLAASAAQMVMINLEDIWEETIPQNIPGTTVQHPNWQKKFTRTIAQWPSLPMFQATVEILNRHRMVRP